MAPITILIIGLIPITLIIIAVVKSSEKWRRQLASIPRMQQFVVLLGLAMAVSIGGTKVGPTKANLKILLAERAGKLSNGQTYGSKSSVVSAAQSVSESALAVTNAVELSRVIRTSLTNSQAVASSVAESTRYYIRLTSPSPSVTNHTIYAEITGISVSNGVATASVWFNVVPNSAPVMRFNFASENATNLWFTAYPTISSFPDTFVCGGKDCYLFYFAVPLDLLNGNGNLLAPLQWEKRVSFGSPETGEPMDIKGGIAIYSDGNYYVAVTGWRTNSVGELFYFDNGRLASPPVKTLNTTEDITE